MREREGRERGRELKRWTGTLSLPRSGHLFPVQAPPFPTLSSSLEEQRGARIWETRHRFGA